MDLSGHRAPPTLYLNNSIVHLEDRAASFFPLNLALEIQSFAEMVVVGDHPRSNIFQTIQFCDLLSI